VVGLLAGGALFAIAGCGADAGSGRAAKPVMSFEQFRAQAYREPDTGVYIVEGDTPAENDERLRELYDAYVADIASQRDEEHGFDIGTTRDQLIVNRVANADDRWNVVRQLNIVYCVSTTFGANYATVVDAMIQAALAWHRVADVNFQYRSDQDASCDANNDNVTFDVRPTSGQPFLARAFFPSTARPNRNILIDASSFVPIPPFTLTGVLRHEIGHTLGFRHEHIRPEETKRLCSEDNNWRVLTPYDSASVMFNPGCNGSNRGDLALTSLDGQGAAALYGPPPDAGFDVVFYLSSFPDVQAAFGDNFAAIRNHFLNTGLREGRRGSGHFDAIYYLATNPDLAAAFGADNYRAAYDHWLGSGIAEGRRASREFDVRFYLQANPELGAFFGTNYAAALNHWLVFGVFEGRRASADFDVKYYLGQNADLRAALGVGNFPAALAHWIQTGMKEGRRGAPSAPSSSDAASTGRWRVFGGESCGDICGTLDCLCLPNTCPPRPLGQPCSPIGQECNEKFRNASSVTTYICE
jgi:hypothetical protein